MRWMLTMAGLLLFTVTIIGCGGSRQQHLPISLKSIEQEPGTGDPQDRERILRVAISSITSAKESIIYYDQLLKYLEERLEMRVRIIQRKTYGEVNDLIKAGEVDMAFVCTYAYTLGHDEFGMELLVAPRVKGSTTYRSAVIVRQDSGITKLEELRGRSFAYTDPLSFTGHKYALYLIDRQFGVAPEKFFGSTIFSYSHDNSIRAVVDGLVTAAAVDSLVLDYITEVNPRYAAPLRTIYLSPPFGIPPVVVRPGLDPSLKESLRQVMLNMDQDPRGRDILRDIHVEKFVLIADREYDSIRDVVRKLKNKGIQ